MVEYKHVSEAIERIEMGMKHRRNMTPKEKEMVAYHESGHLIVLYLLHPTDDVFKASIIGRREALGVVHHQPKEELFTRSNDVFQLAESTKEKLNNETQNILQRCLKDVEDLLTKEREILDRFVRELLIKEELDYDEIDAIFKEYGKFSIKL